MGGSVNVTLDTESQGVTKVAFYNGNDLLGEVTSSPYIWKVSNLPLGVHLSPSTFLLIIPLLPIAHFTL